MSTHGLPWARRSPVRGAGMRPGLRDVAVLGVAGVAGVLLAALIAYGAAFLAIALVLLPAIAAGIAALLTNASRAVVGMALLLSVYPTARLSVGPAPLYLFDAALVVALIGVWRSSIDLGFYGRVVLVYLASWIPAWVIQLASQEFVLEPTYALLRSVLAVGAFLVGLWIVRAGRTRQVLVALAVGTFLTSVLTILQAAPPTKPLVRGLLETFAPAAVAGGYRVYPDRAFALFQAPTLLSGFLVTVAIILVGSLSAHAGTQRRVVIVAAAAAGPALLATYSRQWVPALLVGVLALIACRPTIGLRALAGIAVAAMVGLTLLTGGLLDEQYLSERYSRLGTDDRNVQLRLERQEAFLDTFEFASPTSLFGHGFGVQDLIDRGLVPTTRAEELQRGASENAFFLLVYDRGLFAGLIYVGLLFGALALGVAAARRPDGATTMATALTAALATALALHWFDPYFANSVFMQAFLWLVVGLLIATTRLRNVSRA